MKMMKKWISALLMSVMAVSMCVVPVSASTVDQETCEHNGGMDEIEAVAATCTTEGRTAGTRCKLCQEVISSGEVIPATGHTSVTIPAVSATCTADGRTAGSKCSVCDTIITNPEVIPAGHTWTTTPATAATCTDTGRTESKVCSECGATEGGETIPAQGHDYTVSWTWAAGYLTATADAICNRCEEIIASSPTINASQTTNGSTTTYTATTTLLGKTYSDSKSVTTTADGYEIVQETLSDVPSGLQGITSVEDIEAAMIEKIAEETGKTVTSNQKLYDVTLQEDDGSGNMVPVTTIPAGGLQILLGYPEGTTKDGYNFTVAHMVTSGANAGDVEILEVTKTDEGLLVTVTSLSPIMVAWEQIQGTATGTNTAEATTVGAGAAAGSAAKGISGIPKTGDTANIGVLLVCMLASVAGAGVVLKKKYRA